MDSLRLTDADRGVLVYIKGQDNQRGAFMALDVLDDRCEVLVLGIGNILWADEGFGPRCVEHFHRLYEDRPEVRVEDGGTLGFYLMNLITSARRILVFDCCDFHEEPGTMMVLRDDDVEPWLTTKISPHQTGFSELLATAALMAAPPRAWSSWGFSPKGSTTTAEAFPTRSGTCLTRRSSSVVPKWRAGALILPAVPKGPKSRRSWPPAWRRRPMRKAVPARPRPAVSGDERFLVRPAGVHVEDPSFERK